jgi:signal transduction histidine kinase
MESIFDPYVTTNNTKKNSGLGLYMAKLLIEESMHGILRVKNQNGGACFEITLPKGEKRYE